MKHANQIYKVLLKLYPQSYREAFGTQMMQTFIDHYADVEKSEGRVSLSFWLSVITDEVRNIPAQHLTPLKGTGTFLEVTVTKLALSAVLLIPLYVLFYAVLVQVSLALPHPHLSGIGVLIALAALLLLPGVFSLVASYALASAVVRILPSPEVRAD